MTKKNVLFTVAITATLVTNSYASNVNPATIGYVQEQVAVLNSKTASIPYKRSN